MDIDMFRNYLLSKGLVTENQVTHYLRWVELFLQCFPLKEGDPITDSRVDEFLASLANQRPDWQLDQAREAISLFRFCQSKTKLSVHHPAPSWRDEWAQAAEKMRRMLRLKQRAYRTEETYMRRLRSFCAYVRPALPAQLVDNHIQDYLSYLAVERRVSKSTQNQAFNALLFFYRHILNMDVGSIKHAVRSKRGRRLPTVLTQDETRALISEMKGVARLMARAVYGGGLRLNECLRLRVKDLDFGRGTITVRSGKGDKDRQTLLPESLEDDLRTHLEEVVACEEMAAAIISPFADRQVLR